MPRKTFEFGAGFLLQDEVQREYRRLLHEAGFHSGFGARLDLERFWAREHAAFLVAAEGSRRLYGEFLPGRLFTYLRLVDLINAIELASDSAILEMGSGSGICLALLGRGGFQCTALDIAASAINFSEALARHFGSALNQGIVADFFDVPPDAGTFDLVFNLGAMEHRRSGDQERLFHSMASCSRRWIIIVVPNPLSPIFQTMELEEFSAMPPELVYPEEIETHEVDLYRFDSMEKYRLREVGAFHLAPPRRILRSRIEPEAAEVITRLAESVRHRKGPLVQRWLEAERDFVKEEGHEVAMRLGWFKYGVYERGR